MFPNVTLVLGGASSGKSAFAEKLVKSQPGVHVYLASAQAFDDEMAAKITRHRDARGQGWQTVEAPLDIAAQLGKFGNGDVVLFDCATLWLSNHMLADHDITAQQNNLIRALADCAAPVVVVSNEVGHSVVPENTLSRQFRDAQGKLNQQIAANADLVVAVMAGLPMVLKGSLPESVA